MRRKRIVWLIVGGALLLVVLVGAAFMGGRLLSRRMLAGGNGGGLFMSGSSGNHQHISVHTRPAPELPQAPAAAEGVFVRREDRSIFIGAGQAKLMVKPGQNGQPNTASSYNGPVVEAVVNQDTTIYCDTTKLPDDASGDVTLQQTVAVGSIEEIGQNSMLQVWGSKTGDRIVADTLVYTQPPIMNAKPGK